MSRRRARQCKALRKKRAEDFARHGQGKRRIQRAEQVCRSGLVGGDLDAPTKRKRAVKQEFKHWKEELTWMKA